MRSPYEWHILGCDEKPQTNKQTTSTAWSGYIWGYLTRKPLSKNYLEDIIHAFSAFSYDVCDSCLPLFLTAAEKDCCKEVNAYTKSVAEVIVFGVFFVL